MATRYSKEKYARIKNLKNEPLANLTSGSKKRKLGDEKAEVSFPNPSVHVTAPFPTPSLEVITATPPVTRAKGKSKIGMSVWDDPATTLGRAHNVITSDELKSLSSVPSHELVSRHIWCSSATDFSSMDFEKIDIEVLEDEAKELEEVEFGVPEKDKAAEEREEDGAAGDKVADEPPTLPL
nr:hypothetical protein CFP56_18922 [Quercus suber]